MYETYRCPDGREVVLTFNADSLQVNATSRDGEIVGGFQFALVEADGKIIDMLKDRGEAGEAMSLKLVRFDVDSVWEDQGIAEHAVRLAADETMLEPAANLPKDLERLAWQLRST